MQEVYVRAGNYIHSTPVLVPQSQVQTLSSKSPFLSPVSSLINVFINLENFTGLLKARCASWLPWSLLHFLIPQCQAFSKGGKNT